MCVRINSFTHSILVCQRFIQSKYPYTYFKSNWFVAIHLLLKRQESLLQRGGECDSCIPCMYSLSLYVFLISNSVLSPFRTPSLPRMLHLVPLQLTCTFSTSPVFLSCYLSFTLSFVCCLSVSPEVFKRSTVSLLNVSLEWLRGKWSLSDVYLLK